MHTEDQAITVRRAEAYDLERLVEIYVASCHTAYAEVLNDSYHQFLDDSAANGTWKQTYERHLGALSTIVLVIEKATQIEGFAILTNKGNGNGELDELFFHPSAMGRGLGTILFDAVITQARALSVTKLTLEVVEQNARALAFYKSKNWTKTRRYLHTTSGHQTIQMLELALSISPGGAGPSPPGLKFS
jgi:ribosomal protein S18 acetylase RimI-like enzyme